MEVGNKTRKPKILCDGDHLKCQRLLVENLVKQGYIVIGKPRCADLFKKEVKSHWAICRAMYVGKRRAPEIEGKKFEKKVPN